LAGLVGVTGHCKLIPYQAYSACVNEPRGPDLCTLMLSWLLWETLPSSNCHALWV
jgi:hypothetical protein